MRLALLLTLLLLTSTRLSAAFVRCYQCCPQNIDQIICRLEDCACQLEGEARGYRELSFRLDFQDPMAARYYYYLACRLERRHARLCAKIQWLRYGRQRLCAPC